MKIQVPPSGVREAKIAIIADCPIDEEITRGQAFPSNTRLGKTLSVLLQNVQINKNELYFTSIFKHMVPKGIGQYIKYSKKTNKFTITEAYKAYALELYEELGKVSANVFVPLGDASLYALTGQWGIIQRRGSIYKGVPDISGRKVIGTRHPEKTYKQYELSYSILADLARIKVQSEYPGINIPRINLIIKPTFQESLKYLALCMTKPQVGFDIETANGEVTMISVAYKDTEGISIPFIWQGFSHYSESEEAELWRQIGLLLQNNNIQKLTQNGTYDTTFLFDKYGIRCGNLGDTMIQHAILYPELKKDLGFITSTQTEVQYYKDEGKFIQGVSRATDKDMAGYNIKDSTVLITAFNRLEENLIRQGNQETCEYQTRLVPILSYMNTLGMRMDVKGLKEAKLKALVLRDECKAKILEMSGGVITNPNSHPQVKNYFYISCGIKPIRAKGSVTVDNPALQKISLMGYKIADVIIEYRHNDIYSNQFYGMILGDDGRFRNSTNPVGTKNGRLSSSSNFEGEGTNAQNMPTLLKRFVLADEGYLLYDFDLSQAENRIVAYIAPEPAMIEAFETGIDVHAKTASLIFDEAIEDIIKADKFDILCPFGNGKKTMRFWGKTSDHQFNYDMGPITYARKYGILPKDAKTLLALYHTAYPGVRRYHTWVRDDLSRNNLEMINPYGRHRKFLGRTGDQMNRQAYNFLPQSTVADKINREGLIFLYEDQDRFKHLELLNQVHDSIVVQIPISIPLHKHAEMIAHLRDSLEQEISWRGRKFIIPLDAKVGLNLAPYDKESNPKGMIEFEIGNDSSVMNISAGLTSAYQRLQNGA